MMSSSGMPFILRYCLRILFVVRGINVVRTEEIELFAFREHVIHGRDGLLIHGFSGVEDVLGQFFAFILHRVEEQPIVALEHRQHGFAAHGGPAAEDDGDLVLHEELFRFSANSGQFEADQPRRVRSCNLPPIDAAAFVDFVEGEQQTSLRDVSLMAIVPLREWRTPTLTVSAAEAVKVRRWPTRLPVITF